MKRAGAGVGGAVINSRRNIQSLGPSKCPWLSGPPTPTALSLAETHLILPSWKKDQRKWLRKWEFARGCPEQIHISSGSGRLLSSPGQTISPQPADPCPACCSRVPGERGAGGARGLETRFPGVWQLLPSILNLSLQAAGPRPAVPSGPVWALSPPPGSASLPGSRGPLPPKEVRRGLL